MWLYSFKTWGEKQADQYYDEIAKGLDLIASYPEIGIDRSDLGKGYRCFKIKEYEVYYRIKKATISIIRVLHENREPLL